MNKLTIRKFVDLTINNVLDGEDYMILLKNDPLYDIINRGWILYYIKTLFKFFLSISSHSVRSDVPYLYTDLMSNLFEISDVIMDDEGIPSIKIPLFEDNELDELAKRVKDKYRILEEGDMEKEDLFVKDSEYTINRRRGLLSRLIDIDSKIDVNKLIRYPKFFEENINSISYNQTIDMDFIRRYPDFNWNWNGLIANKNIDLLELINMGKIDINNNLQWENSPLLTFNEINANLNIKKNIMKIIPINEKMSKNELMEYYTNTNSKLSDLEKLDILSHKNIKIKEMFSENSLLMRQIFSFLQEDRDIRLNKTLNQTNVYVNKINYFFRNKRDVEVNDIELMKCTFPNEAINFYRNPNMTFEYIWENWLNDYRNDRTSSHALLNVFKNKFELEKQWFFQREYKKLVFIEDKLSEYLAEDLLIGIKEYVF